MILSNTTAYLDDKFTVKEVIKIFKNAGFDAYDISLSHLFENLNLPTEWNCDNYREKAAELRAFADELGIICNQSHAPYPSSVGDNEKDEQIFQNIVKAMEIASILGAKIIVVHPKAHLDHSIFADKLFKINMEFYNRLIPYCKKFGIKIATENMWQLDDNTQNITHCVCSRPEEFCKYVDTLNSEWVVGCLDIGHCELVNENIAGFIKALGNKRLQALHIHDVDGKHDLHTIPFAANIDLDAVCKALAEIDYKGDFTYETCSYFYKLPRELCSDGSKLLVCIGRYLINKIEAYKMQNREEA